MRRVLLGVAIALMPAAAGAATYYVSPAGRDTNVGTSSTAPFATVAHAAALTNPGDIVQLMGGTYPPFVISRSGAPNAYITYEAYRGQVPTVLKNGTAWNGIGFSANTTYIVIAGLHVLGDRTITLAAAQAAPNNAVAYNGNCIGGTPSNHHIVVRNNTVSYCPGAGIQLGGDYISIYRNVVDHNSFWSPLDTSGIAVSGVNSDASTAGKIFVYDNVIYGNQDYICNRTETNPCRISDGSGIIVDSNKNTAYTGRVEIYNNIVYDNGCRGIQASASNNVDIYNNTTYQNEVSATEPPALQGCLQGGEIVVAYDTNTRVMNNISVGRPGANSIFSAPEAGVYGLYRDTNTTWDYNITWGGLNPAALGPHDLVADPLFTSWLMPPTTIACGAFGLRQGSPAFGTGTSPAPTTDITSAPRSSAIDRGACKASW